MAWALLDDNFPLHPKVMAAVEIHPLARDLFVCALCYCRKFHTDGTIPSHVLKVIGFAGNIRRATDALVSVGLWDRVDCGYQIHDYAQMYDDVNAKTAVEEKRRKRQESGRRGGLSRAANLKQTSGFASSNAVANVKPIGLDRSGVGVVGSSEELTDERIGDEFQRFQAAYPTQGRIGGPLPFDYFRSARLSGVSMLTLLEALENHAASAQWLDGRIPNMTRWLQEQRWLSRLDPPKVAAVVDSKLPAWAQRGLANLKAGQS
jgi:hypothetical protein